MKELKIDFKHLTFINNYIQLFFSIPIFNFFIFIFLFYFSYFFTFLISLFFLFLYFFYFCIFLISLFFLFLYFSYFFILLSHLINLAVYQFLILCANLPIYYILLQTYRPLSVLLFLVFLFHLCIINSHHHASPNFFYLFLYLIFIIIYFEFLIFYFYNLYILNVIYPSQMKCSERNKFPYRKKNLARAYRDAKCASGSINGIIFDELHERN